MHCSFPIAHNYFCHVSLPGYWDFYGDVFKGCQDRPFHFPTFFRISVEDVKFIDGKNHGNSSSSSASTGRDKRGSVESSDASSIRFLDKWSHTVDFSAICLSVLLFWIRKTYASYKSYLGQSIATYNFYVFSTSFRKGSLSVVATPLKRHKWINVPEVWTYNVCKKNVSKTLVSFGQVMPTRSHLGL